MAVTTSTSILKLLSQHPLLDAEQLETVNQSLAAKFSEPTALANELIRRGWLSSYQAKYLLAGQTAALFVGPYLLIDRIGEGAAGKVYKARHTTKKLLVALKVLNKETMADPDQLARFQREIEVATALSHPNIVRAYEAGAFAQTQFLAMEYVDGTDLDRMVKDKGKLPADQACNYIRQACLGLHMAQEKGLVHRDIKPSNLLVSLTEEESLKVTRGGGWPTPWGVVKILDLGLARITPTASSTTSNLTAMGGSSVMLGTPDFMAPEQALDFADADTRSDIYSLGCTFYFLLTGSLVFPGGTLPEKLIKHQAIEPKPVEQYRDDLPAELPPLLKRMMAKDPKNRYQTPGEVTKELTKLIARLDPEKATPPLMLKKKPDTVFKKSESTIQTESVKKKVDSTVKTGATKKKDSTVQINVNPFSDIQAEPEWKHDTALKTGAAPKKDSQVKADGAVEKSGGLGDKLKALTGAEGEMPGWLTRLTELTQSHGKWVAAGVGGLIVLLLVLYVVFLGGMGGSTDSPPADKTVVPKGPEEKVYLADMQESAPVVGHGKLGKKGDLGYDNKRVWVNGEFGANALSMHPPAKGSAKVSYFLAGKYRLFKSTVALNDDVDSSDSPLTFIVQVDGKQVWQSRPIKNRGEIDSCSVSVEGAKLLLLMVACPGPHNKAHAVWVDPAVTK